jgi:hypothetical protein
VPAARDSIVRANPYLAFQVGWHSVCKFRPKAVEKMEGVELRSKRGQKDEKIRRSYSCSDIAQLLGLPEAQGCQTVDEESSVTMREKVGSAASQHEVASRRVSTLVRLRQWQSRKKKPDGPPVISAPVQPSSLTPQTSPNRLATILPLPQNINFNNPFGTVGRRNKRRPREGTPIVVLEKCFGPPPTSSRTLPPLGEHSTYPLHANPFGTLPRMGAAAKRVGVANGGRDRNNISGNVDIFRPPSISVSPSPSPSRSPSHSPSHSPSLSPATSLSDALTVIDQRTSTNLTGPNYHSLLGKSMEKLPMHSGMESPSGVGPFRIELGADSREFELSCNQSAHTMLENPESETRWYFKYFLGKVHHNYLCYDTDKNPFFLSMVNSSSIIRCILWRNTGCKRLSIREDSNGKLPSVKSLLEKFSVNKYMYDKSVKEVVTEKIQKEFLTMEEQEGAVNFKFGVLYAQTGQTTDNEMYGNEHGSKRFSSFLELLGDEVALEGWQNFRGGLDVKKNTTGATSVFTVFEGHEIMFHVSTLLPHSSENVQQLERKRHLGNDIVVIVFVEGKNPEDAYESCLTFDPSCMKSHFNHIFALVSYDHIKSEYRLVVHSAESVPRFGPSLPARGVFSESSSFRDFLLTKLINGEKASYCTPTFSEKRNRTLSLLLKDVEHKCTTEYRRTLSVPVLKPAQSSPAASRKYAELEQSFTDYGQRLKVQKIITGHHPTSQRTTVSPKRDPWEPTSITEDFPFKIVCGDYCDDGTLIVSTESNGTFFIYKDGSYTPMLNKSVVIGQVVVAHKHHLLLFRTAYAKDTNYFYAIPLRHFYSEKIVLDSKSSLGAYQISCTKGCHLFCTAPLSGQFLRVAVACKAKVFMLAWKHPSLSSSTGGVPLAPQAPANPAESFIKHRELSLPDVPWMMTLLDERPSGKLCVSYQKQPVVDAVDEIKATTQRIPNLDIAKSKLICLSSVYCNGHSELLIGYNLTSQLITLHDGTAYNSAEVVWNSEPKDIGTRYTHSPTTVLKRAVCV